jgi:hypothetical protein
MLTKKHKSKRMASLFEHLCCYQDGESFVESIIKGDETWVYEFTPESERNSVTWKYPHSPITHTHTQTPSAKKMATVCLDEGLLLCEFLLLKTAVNSNKYCETLEKL